MEQNDSFARLKERRPGLAAAEVEIALSEAIAELIVDARVQAKLSQAALARLAGTSQARISELEHGEGNPTVETLARVAAALGIGAFNLMGGYVTDTTTAVLVPMQASILVSTEGVPLVAPTAAEVTVGNAHGFVMTEEDVNDNLAAASSNLAIAA